MTPDAVRAQYRAMMEQRGAMVQLRRYTGTDEAQVFFDVDVLAVPVQNEASLLAGTVIQGRQQILLLAEDIFEAQFPVPLRKNDKVVLRERELNIDSIDDNTRRVAGELIAFMVEVEG